MNITLFIGGSMEKEMAHKYLRQIIFQKRVKLESNSCMFDHTCYTYGGSYYQSYVTNLRQMVICSVPMKIYVSSSVVNEKFGLKCK